MFIVGSKAVTKQLLQNIQENRTHRWSQRLTPEFVDVTLNERECLYEQLDSGNFRVSPPAADHGI